jgi:hypothetical protein
MGSDSRLEKERSEGRDHRWMLESADPERKKLEEASTASVVVAWRCD